MRFTHSRFLFVLTVTWFRIRKLSGHCIWSQLGFYGTWANFGQPMSDGRLLFAALLLVIEIIVSYRLRILHACAWIWILSLSVQLDTFVYLTSECIEQVRYRVEHEKMKFISKSGHVKFCLLHKHTNNNVFDDFPKIFQNCSKGLTNVIEHFLTIFRRLPKVAEDFRVGTDDVSIMQNHPWVLFKRLCSYSNGNLKTCDNNLIFLHMKISNFYKWKYMDFLSGRNTNKTLVLI